MEWKSPGACERYGLLISPIELATGKLTGQAGPDWDGDLHVHHVVMPVVAKSY